MNPTVSVLIPVHNAEQWVGQAIESSLAQEWPGLEVIVVDDGSTDRSVEVIRQYRDRIRWETGPNRGGNQARNRLLSLSNGEWLQYLDADDYILPGKIQRQMTFVRSNPNVDVVFGPVEMEYIDAGRPRRELRSIPEPHDPWILLARWFLPQTGAPLWRKQAILDVDGWNADQPCCQEHELYLRLLIAGKRFAYCPHNGAVYRQWSEGTVCRRNPVETRRRRLQIVKDCEDFLIQRNELTPARLSAINQSRFELARTAWQYGRGEALAIMQTVHQVQPHFLPRGEAATPRYRAFYRLLGFRLTQVLADYVRKSQIAG